MPATKPTWWKREHDVFLCAKMHQYGWSLAAILLEFIRTYPHLSNFDIHWLGARMQDIRAGRVRGLSWRETETLIMDVDRDMIQDMNQSESQSQNQDQDKDVDTAGDTTGDTAHGADTGDA